MLVVIFITLFSQFYLVYTCSCDLSSHHDVYCRADWVARMRIIDKKIIPDQLNRTSYLVYSVKAIELFKDPKGIMFTARRLFSMSETIFTPSQSSICGISMEINKEYLLAGRTVNESMLMLVSVCDQFTEFGEPEPMNQCLVPLPEDRSRKSDIFAQLLEWERISEGLKEQLRRKSLEPCFNF